MASRQVVAHLAPNFNLLQITLEKVRFPCFLGDEPFLPADQRAARSFLRARSGRILRRSQ
jgi:hypothetical protein